MFVGYANNHAGDTYKLLNLRMKHIWKSRDIKWIATSIKHLKRIRETDAKLPISDKDDDDDAVLNYVQATGINLIPADDEDDAAPTPAHQDDDADSTDEEVQPVAVAQPPASCDKTLHAMRQLSTFYNPIATAYLEDNHSVSSEDTELTSNRLGKEVATSILDETHGDLDGDLNQVPSMVSMAINYLPNFAFYTRNQVLTPSTNEVRCGGL